jgi:hypothetical protein
MKLITFLTILLATAALGLFIFVGGESKAGGPALLDVGSDGSDGDLVVAANRTIDLSLAVPAPWDTPSPVPGSGVYDAEKWAVVFKYSSVTINASRFLTFTNHPSRAPVVWLVAGDVIIAGTITLSGEGQTSPVTRPTEPGPGGFRGGLGHDTGSVIRSGGFGPGGGAREGSNNGGGAGSHGTAGAGNGIGVTYGEEHLLQLLGGSGGAGGRFGAATGLLPGAAGGGAILIAAGGTITVNGNVLADGGDNFYNAGGSGGSIRLVARLVQGSGGLYARGGTGGFNSLAAGKGIIRVEAFESTLTPHDPPYSFAFTGDPAQIWPPASAPRLRVTRVRNAAIGQVPAPADPRARLDAPLDADVIVTTSEPLVVEVAAENVPLDAAMSVRVVPRLVEDFVVPAAPIAGDATASTWAATFTAPHGISSVQARVDLP